MELYNIARKEGRWGFWSDAFDEAEMLKRVKNGDRTVGGFIDKDRGPVIVKALGGDRKKIVGCLPKQRTFFEMPNLPEDFNERWTIVWVGHIRCFPYHPPTKQQMLAEGHDAEELIAVYKSPRDDGQIGASTIKIDNGMLIPPTTCCDL